MLSGSSNHLSNNEKVLIIEYLFLFVLTSAPDWCKIKVKVLEEIMGFEFKNWQNQLGGNSRRYKKYKDRVCLICVGVKAKEDKNKGMRFIITPATSQVLGHPNKVFLQTSNMRNIIGIMPVAKHGDPQDAIAFAVTPRLNGSEKQVKGVRSVSCKSFAAEVGLRPSRVYTNITVEDYTLIVDLSDHEPLHIYT